MANRYLVKPRFLVLIPLLLVLMIAVACGDDATPVPEATQAVPTLDVAAIQAAVREAVRAEASGAAPAVSAEQIQEMVQAAVGGISTGLTADEILTIVKSAVPEGASVEEIQALVETAVTAAAAEQLTAEEVQSMVQAAAAGQLTAEEVQSIVKAAIPPTATPLATPRPTPTPGFFTSGTQRLVLVVDRDLRDGNLPWRTVGAALSIRPMNEGLIVVDRFDGTFIPNLATKWVMRPDGKQWTISLKKDVAFQNGWGEFTARDVIHAWERVVSEDGLTSNKSLIIKAIAGEDSFTIANDHELVINFQILQPDWPVIMSELEEDFLITSKTQFDLLGTQGMEKAPAGTGPFRQTDRALDEFATYERVENHWRQTPEFRELLIRQVDENATKLAMLLTEEAHIASLPRELQEEALNRGMVRMKGSVPRGTAWHYIMGGLYSLTPDKYDPDLPVTNIKVREALSRAIDRQEIVDTIFAGRATLATHEVFQPSLAGWDPEWPERFEQLNGYDPARARELLAEAGYADGFDLDIYDFPYGGSPELNQINQALAQYWNAIGVNTKLISVDYPTIRPDFMGKEIPGKSLGFPPYGRYEPYVLMELVHKSDGPFVQYEDAVLDGLFDDLNDTLDADKRDDLQRQIGEQLLVSYAVLPLVFTFFEGMYNPEVITEYVVPGNQTGGFTNLEYVKANR